MIFKLSCDVGFDYSEEIIQHSLLLIDSFERLTGKNLLPNRSAEIHALSLAQGLYELDAVVLSHNGGGDPIFTYANRKAQEIFEYDWDTFLTLPSRLSAEPDRREDRSAMLQSAAEQGYISNYGGVRVSASGRRFEISNAIIWNLEGEDGAKVGQAAVFDQFVFL